MKGNGAVFLLLAMAGAGLFIFSRRVSASGNYNVDLPESLSDLINATMIDPFKFSNPWDAISPIPSPVLQPSIPLDPFGSLTDFMRPGVMDSILYPSGKLDTTSAGTGVDYVMKQWKTPAVGETGPGKYGPERVTFNGTQYDKLFRDAEIKYGIPYGTLSRMAWQESRYNPDAISGVGAYGLMQIMPATARGYGVAAVDLKNPKIAIDLAGKILRDFYKSVSPVTARSWPAAIVAYNQGPGNVNRAIAEKGPLILDWLGASNIGSDGRGYYQVAVDVGLAPAGIASTLSSSSSVAGINNTPKTRG